MAMAQWLANDNARNGGRVVSADENTAGKQSRIRGCKAVDCVGREAIGRNAKKTDTGRVVWVTTSVEEADLGMACRERAVGVQKSGVTGCTGHRAIIGMGEDGT